MSTTNLHRMTKWATHCAALLFAVYVAGAVAVRAAHQSAGSDEQGWVVLPTSVPLRAAGLGDRPCELCHLPGDASPGFLRRVTALSDFPDAMAASGSRVVLFYKRALPELSDEDASGANEEATGADADDFLPGWEVREVAVDSKKMEGIYEYVEDGRQRILPSLDATALLASEKGVEPSVAARGVRLIDAVCGEGWVAVLVRTYRGPSLWMLQNRSQGWLQASLPIGVSGGLRLLANGDELVLLGIGPDAATQWTCSVHEVTASGWSASSVAIGATDAAVVPAGWGSLLAVRYTAGMDDALGTVAISLVRGNERASLAAVEGVVSEYAVVRIGERIAVVWLGDDNGASVHMAMVSALTGRVMFQGEAVGRRLGEQEMQLLVLLLGAVLLTVLVFVLRSDAQQEYAVPVLPVRTSLALPRQRAIAAGLDMAGAAWCSVLIWNVPLGVAAGVGEMAETSQQMWPAVTSLGIMLAHGTLGEWLFGRTLGKTLLRCRVADMRGRRPSLARAFLRNAVKATFPPIGIFILLDPLRRHPGDLLGGTLVVTPLPDGPEGAEQAPDDTPDE